MDSGFAIWGGTKSGEMGRAIAFEIKQGQVEKYYHEKRSLPSVETQLFSIAFVFRL